MPFCLTCDLKVTQDKTESDTDTHVTPTRDEIAPTTYRCRSYNNKKYCYSPYDAESCGGTGTVQSDVWSNVNVTITSTASPYCGNACITWKAFGGSVCRRRR
ncbi:hypothetical protein ElyMa_005634100 [Elysia marginata]|uniref:Uncharacterized protein n=1 Tax=Elysia marginata TaxID=1093978 RepID=A0AAV4F8J3_9GAST|nr:hypothetical protein ElyMa_005634100 [Elysia marginata]